MRLERLTMTTSFIFLIGYFLGVVVAAVLIISGPQ